MHKTPTKLPQGTHNPNNIDMRRNWRMSFSDILKSPNSCWSSCLGYEIPSHFVTQMANPAAAILRHVVTFHSMVTVQPKWFHPCWLTLNCSSCYHVNNPAALVASLE